VFRGFLKNVTLPRLGTIVLNNDMLRANINGNVQFDVGRRSESISIKWIPDRPIHERTDSYRDVEASAKKGFSEILSLWG